MNRRTLTTKRRPPAKEPVGEAPQVSASATSPPDANVDAQARREWIAIEAYFLAERRGFTPGSELDDWLAAEAIVEGCLRGTRPRGNGDDRHT